MLDFGQIYPRNTRKSVMFIMIASIKKGNVSPAIGRESFALLIDVMFSDRLSPKSDGCPSYLPSGSNSKRDIKQLEG